VKKYWWALYKLNDFNEGSSRLMEIISTDGVHPIKYAFNCNNNKNISLQTLNYKELTEQEYKEITGK
jgi:hypothetical protein